MTSRITCASCGGESIASGARLHCAKCYAAAYAAERERCCKAMCRWCDRASGKSYALATVYFDGVRWIHEIGDDARVECDAAAIRNLPPVAESQPDAPDWRALLERGLELTGQAVMFTKFHEQPEWLGAVGMWSENVRAALEKNEK